MNNSSAQQDHSVCRDTALAHLRLLGYRDGDKIYLRGFLPKTHPDKAKDKGRKTEGIFPNLPLTELEKWQREDRGVYFVVNGGGQADRDVTQCRAIYYEHDKLEPELSETLWIQLGLPEPTFQVATGGKSIHTYWVLNDPIPPELWRKLQTDLLEFADADRSLKNPSRVMRLAGFLHTETGQQSTIINECGKTYSYERLRALVPVAECKPKPEPKPKPQKPQRQTVNVDRVPLMVCLAPNIRDYINKGMGEGNRNTTGAAVARELIGAANDLDREGISYDGNPRELFDRYCGNCIPALDTQEADTIWRSAEKSNPGSSLGLPKMKNCIKAWRKRQNQPNTDKPVKKRVTEATVEELEAVGKKAHFESIPDKGLFWRTYLKNDDGEFQPVNIRVGNHLTPIAYLTDSDGGAATIVFELMNQRGIIKRVKMSRRLLGGDRAQIIGELTDSGYGYVFNQSKLLARYLTETGSEQIPEYIITDITGWHGSNFVLPTQTIGDQLLRFKDINPPKNPLIETRGTAATWRQTVGKKATGNSRLIFAIGTSFAATLLKILEIESGGFHFVGQTSKGKTTILNVAASVIGLLELPTWNTTVNGLESNAAEFNHLLLPLDEIGEANSKDVGAAAYMLGNGTGKQRMAKDLTRRKTQTWRLLTLSSGELGLGEYLKQAGISQKGGQEIRLPDVPACPKDSPHGVFETIHGADSAAAFVDSLEADCRANRGAVLLEWLTWLVADQANPEWVATQRRRLWEIVDQLMVGIVDAATGRVAKRFALVQLALEIAHGYGLLPFPIEQAAWATKTLFTDWLTKRGGTGSLEVKQVMERIELEFASSYLTNRIYKVGGGYQETRNLLAIYDSKPDSEPEYWVSSSVFKELAKGCDRDLLIAEMQARGWLLGPDPKGKNALPRWFDGQTKRFYIFREFWDIDSESAANPPQLDSVNGANPQTVGARG